MTDGVERARLRTYLTGAQHETTDMAGDNWRQCGYLLAETAAALRKGASQIRDGEGEGSEPARHGLSLGVRGFSVVTGRRTRNPVDPVAPTGSRRRERRQ